MKFRFLFIFFNIFLFAPIWAQSLDTDIFKKACLKQVQQKNWDNAVQECHKAAQHGSKAAATILGRIFEKGLQGKIDLEKATHWYELAAQKGSKEAAYRLAELRLTPNSALGFNPKKAAPYLEKAYQNGHIKAGLLLASMLQAGQHIPTDHEAAFNIYQNLSSQSREANYQSGKMLMAGQGIEKDEEKAFQYYMIAAKAGLVKAQKDLGLAYFEGSAVQISLFDAYKWLDIASFQGDMEAASALHIIENEIDEDTAYQARKAARFWLCENKQMACKPLKAH